MLVQKPYWLWGVSLREASEYQRTARTLSGSRVQITSKQLVASAEYEVNNIIAGPTKEASSSTR